MRDLRVRLPKYPEEATLIFILWMVLFWAAPLPFQGPEFVGSCQNIHIYSCTFIQTTRWHWLGAFHAILSPEGKDYPAVMQYEPTSAWELRAWVAGSLVLASILCIVVGTFFGSTRRRADTPSRSNIDKTSHLDRSL